jgi:hypothetical protein
MAHDDVVVYGDDDGEGAHGEADALFLFSLLSLSLSLALSVSISLSLSFSLIVTTYLVRISVRPSHHQTCQHTVWSLLWQSPFWIALFPRQDACERRKYIIETVAHDDVVVDGDDDGEGAHVEADAAGDRGQLPHGHGAKLRELAECNLHEVHWLA